MVGAAILELESRSHYQESAQQAAPQQGLGKILTVSGILALLFPFRPGRPGRLLGCQDRQPQEPQGSALFGVLPEPGHGLRALVEYTASGPVVGHPADAELFCGPKKGPGRRADVRSVYRPVPGATRGYPARGVVAPWRVV
jgi:hypothetical protein